MAKKLEGNGMWESSRMILPEHREAMIWSREEIKYVSRPELDEQLMEENVRKLSEAMRRGRAVWLEIYDRNGPIRVAGFVQQIDPHEQRLKLLHEGRKTWVPFADILRVE